MRIVLLSILLQLLTFYFSDTAVNEINFDNDFAVEEVSEEESDVVSYLKRNRYEHMLVLIPKTNELKELSPILGKDFLGFKEAVGFRESSGNYFIINQLGYLGKYQFGGAAMQDLGIKNKRAFLKSPELQERAFVAFCSLNKYKLRRYIVHYDGKVVGGVKLTESGMLAAAHLVGPGAVKQFIKSRGKVKASDGNGTNIVEYLTTFSGYDTSIITATKRVKVKLS